MPTKGSGCLSSGKKYELEVYNVVKKCTLNNNNFNTQKEDELGGCSSKNDIECIMDNIVIPIEIKKSKTPDWMQCSIKYDRESKKWLGSPKSKIPEKSKNIFEVPKNFTNITVTADAELDPISAHFRGF